MSGTLSFTAIQTPSGETESPPTATTARVRVPWLEGRGLACIRDERTLFQSLDFSVSPGQVLQVEGPNGCGKTSLLRILCGLSLPSEGAVSWRGSDIERARAEYLADMAYLGHAHGVKLDLTPLENLRVARALKRPKRQVSSEAALEAVGLYGFEDVPARMLSAGQCRRVALARLLATAARLWILDEPLTAIDRRGVKKIEELIVAHARSGGMVVLTTHHPVRLEDCQVAHLHLAS